MTAEHYPQDITADELALGFELLVLEGYSSIPGQIHPSPTPVVAKRLGSSDVLIKKVILGKLLFVHKKFGKDRACQNHLYDIRSEWWPLYDPCQDARFAIRRFEAGSEDAAFFGAIIPFAYKYHAA